MSTLPAGGSAATLTTVAANAAAGVLGRMARTPRSTRGGSAEHHLRTGRRLLRYPERTAGALLDPLVTALLLDVRASDAIEDVS